MGASKSKCGSNVVLVILVAKISKCIPQLTEVTIGNPLSSARVGDAQTMCLSFEEEENGAEGFRSHWSNL